MLVVKSVPSFPAAMQLNAFSEEADVVVVDDCGSLQSIRRRVSSGEEDDLLSTCCNDGVAVPIPPRAA